MFLCKRSVQKAHRIRLCYKKTRNQNMTAEYILKPDILGHAPEVAITEQEYKNAKRCHKQNYEAFEIELAFDFVVKNYIEIEKYIAEHLVLDMTGQENTEDTIREQHWGFMRVLNNWLSSIQFWHDVTRSRLIKICGRSEELRLFESVHSQLINDEFAYAFIFQLRNYSQHGGFPITGYSQHQKWNKDFSQLSFSAAYTLNYDSIRPYFENGKGARSRKEFGKKIEVYSDMKTFDLKPIVRNSLEILVRFMNSVRSSMSSTTTKNEAFILTLIEKYKSSYPDASIIGLSAMPVNDRKTVNNRYDIIPVRDEFITRALSLRKRNNEKFLGNMNMRIIFNGADL